MPQTLNGHERPNDAASYADDVGQWRKAIHRYDFAVDGGATAAYTTYTVTGDVEVQTYGICKTSLTSGGAATIELGIAGNTAALIAQTTATDLDQYETWQDAGPEANPGDVATAHGSWFAIANGADIILTIGGAALTAGVIDFYCFWRPLSTNGSVV